MNRYRKDHPLRPVNWRWEQARCLKEQGKRYRDRNKVDGWVKGAYKLQVCLDNSRDENDRNAALDAAGALGIAYELWDNNGSFNDGRRWQTGNIKHEIEARILAEQPFTDIANKVAVDESVLKIYEKVFFNVLDRTKQTSWVIHQVIGPSIHRGTTDRDSSTIWKAYAYFTKSVILIDFLTSTFMPENEAAAEEIDKILFQDGRASARRKATLAMRMLSLNPYVQEKMLELQNRNGPGQNIQGDGRQIEHDDDYAQIEGANRKEVDAVLGALPWKITGNDQQNGGELRAHELLQIANGESVAPIKKFEFSESSDNDSNAK